MHTKHVFTSVRMSRQRFAASVLHCSQIFHLVQTRKLRNTLSARFGGRGGWLFAGTRMPVSNKVVVGVRGWETAWNFTDKINMCFVLNGSNTFSGALSALHSFAMLLAGQLGHLEIQTWHKPLTHDHGCRDTCSRFLSRYEWHTVMFVSWKMQAGGLFLSPIGGWVWHPQVVHRVMSDMHVHTIMVIESGKMQELE